MSTGEKPYQLSQAKLDVTTDPVLRVGMERFFRLINDDDITKVLTNVYAEQQTVSQYQFTSLHEYQQEVVDTLEMMLGPEINELHRSNTVDVSGIVNDLSLMNHPDVWTQLLQKGQKDEAVMRGLKEAMPHVDSREDLSGWGDQISFQNSKFFGKALMYMGVAVTYGSLFPSLLSATERNVMRADTPHPRALYNFGVAIGNYFDSPAESPQEAVDRLRELFPPHAAKSSGVPAWRFVSGSDAFTEYGRQTPSGKVVSAGQEMTGMLFRGFGKVLERGDFRQRIINRATRL